MSDPCHQEETIVPSSIIFPFFQLPAEVRNEIYLLITINKESYSLDNITMPSIAQTSLRLRSEFLPIFFQEGTFHTNILLVNRYRSTFLFPPASKGSMLRFAPGIKAFLDKDNKLFVRTISLRIFQHSPKAVPLWYGRHMTTISLHFSEGHCEIQVKGVGECTRPPWPWWVAVNSRRAARRVRASVDKLAAGERFVGFSLSDMEFIANSVAMGEPVRHWVVRDESGVEM